MSGPDNIFSANLKHYVKIGGQEFNFYFTQALLSNASSIHAAIIEMKKNKREIKKENERARERRRERIREKIRVNRREKEKDVERKRREQKETKKGRIGE